MGTLTTPSGRFARIGVWLLRLNLSRCAPRADRVPGASVVPVTRHRSLSAVRAWFRQAAWVCHAHPRQAGEPVEGALRVGLPLADDVVDAPLKLGDAFVVVVPERVAQLGEDTMKLGVRILLRPALSGPRVFARGGRLGGLAATAAIAADLAGSFVLHRDSLPTRFRRRKSGTIPPSGHRHP